ncbi:MAG: hypothetical protein ACOYNI_01250 [Acidimicrobiia bacterium]
MPAEPCEHGFGVVQNVVVTAFLLGIVVFGLNIFVGLYAQGAVRAAAADAAREGTRGDLASAQQRCEDKAGEVRKQLLAATWAERVAFRCEVRADQVTVRTVTNDGKPIVMPWFVDAVPVTKGIPLDATATFRRRASSAELRAAQP